LNDQASDNRRTACKEACIINAALGDIPEGPMDLGSFAIPIVSVTSPSQPSATAPSTTVYRRFAAASSPLAQLLGLSSYLSETFDDCGHTNTQPMRSEMSCVTVNFRWAGREREEKGRRMKNTMFDKPSSSANLTTGGKLSFTLGSASIPRRFLCKLCPNPV
jgi:hypothetical protein